MIDSHPNSSGQRSSREVSQVVDSKFHRQPNRFRRWINWLSVLISLAILLVLGLAASVGQRRHFQAGPVAPAHRFIENDCGKCHQRWTLVARFNPYYHDVSSVDDESCTTCHAGAPHYAGQEPPHAGLACVACHREHRPDDDLIAQANTHCISCHEDLIAHVDSPTLARNTSRPGANITASVTSFRRDHPEFSVLKENDPTRLRFNHKVHLRAIYDETGNLVEGLINEQGQLEDLSRDCTICHQPVAGEALIAPIRYEAHCQRCHPLLFDNQNFPGMTVPHGVPNTTLRGFLTDLYMTRSLQDTDALRAPMRARSLPGQPQPSVLTKETADGVSQGVTTAELRLHAMIASSLAEAQRLQRQGIHVLFGNEALGGCRLCHDLRDTLASSEPQSGETIGEIEKPGIPTRWLARVRFTHDSHRFLSCQSCHQDFNDDPPRSVAQSTDTGDVLLPSIRVCRQCHGEQSSSLLGFRTNPIAGVRANCTDCHNYHDRRDERFSAVLDNRLTTIVTPGATGD